MSDFSAQPTLMGIAAELRLRIFKYVFAGVPDNEISLDLSSNCENKNESGFEIGQWDVLHPLLITSKQIRNEARECFRLRLELCRVDHCGVFRKDNAGQSWLSEDSVPGGVPLDDYTLILNDFLRKSVSMITIVQSTNGVDGEYFNKRQFSNLEVLEVSALLSLNEELPVADDYYSPRIDPCIFHSLNTGITFDDVKNGRHNGEIAQSIREHADKYTIMRLPSLAERGFRVTIRSWVRFLQQGSVSELSNGGMNVVCDYDTNEVFFMEWESDREYDLVET
ncbi:hypothetical protein PMZ80_010715 [Knufia obscura]|uniref:Uncharacterized protein n=1 Tax=Knufia obscura TaxID=1635080 RepID=A0ABR0R8S7_9EURO|nr:hypothetical protein PMZ80_010715 [Knufia obscura]